MKKIIVLALACILFQACGTKVDTGDLAYKDEVSFKAFQLIKSRVKESAHTTYISPKGTYYPSLYLRFKNNSNEKQVIDTEDFFLLDDQNNKYIVDHATIGGLNVRSDSREISLGPGRNNKLLVLGFDPAFPRNSKVRLMVFDKIYHIE